MLACSTACCGPAQQPATRTTPQASMGMDVDSFITQGPAAAASSPTIITRAVKKKTSSCLQQTPANRQLAQSRAPPPTHSPLAPSLPPHFRAPSGITGGLLGATSCSGVTSPPPAVSLLVHSDVTRLLPGVTGRGAASLPRPRRRHRPTPRRHRPAARRPRPRRRPRRPPLVPVAAPAPHPRLHHLMAQDRIPLPGDRH